MTVNGIDVAHYQPDRYATAGLDFVFVKAAEGTSYVNPSHGAQVAHGRAAGLVVGHYHFVRPGSMAAQAAYFLARSRPETGDLLACDWEDPGVSNADKDAFIKAVQKARPGLRVGLYCNRSYWTTRDTTSFCGSFLWIADPSAPKGEPRVEHPWVFHQYSEAGGVDHNVGNFPDRAALRAWAGGTTTHEEDDMQLNDIVKLGDWTKVWPDAAGLRDGIQVNTALGSGYAHARRADETLLRLRPQVEGLGARLDALHQRLDQLAAQPAPTPEIDYAKLAAALIAAVATPHPSP